MVESVAWITERKNVLSMVFYLSALLAYGRFNSFWGEEKVGSPRHWGAYALAFVLFTAALLSKTTAFSLPAVILLICWWKRGWINWREICLTLPFFAVSIGFCLGTAWLEKNHVGARGPEWAIPFAQRCLIAGRVFWFYLWKLVWPANLSFVYTRWRLNTHSAWEWFFPISAVGVLVWVWLAESNRARTRGGGFLLCRHALSVFGIHERILHALLVCVRSLGLSVQPGAYCPCGRDGRRAAARFHMPESYFGFAGVLLPILAILTWRQCGIYADLETLWRDTLTKNPTTWLALNNLGIVLRNQGKLPEAIALYHESLRYDPDYAETHNNLGVALKKEGKTDEAINEYLVALRIKPDYAEAHGNLGNARARKGQLPEAVDQYDQALRIQPEYAEARYNLAIALTQQGKIDDAIDQYRQTLQIDPDFFEAHCNLAVLFMQQGRFPQAVAEYDEAVRIRPNSATAHNDLALALSRAGQPREAISNWEAALRIKPNYLEAANSLAWQLATVNPSEGGDPNQALALAQKICDGTGYQVPECLDTLAAAFAATGNFNDAIAAAKRGIDLARAGGDTQLVGAIENRLQMYQSGQPYLASPAATRPAN